MSTASSMEQANVYVGSMPALIDKEDEAKEFPLEKLTMIVGQGPGCDLVLDAPGVQARHCLISKSTAGLVLRDLGSGTLVNGRAAEEVVLADGDVIKVGPRQFVVRFPSQWRADGDVQASLFDQLAKRIERLEAARRKWLLKSWRARGKQAVPTASSAEVVEKSSSLRMIVEALGKQGAKLKTNLEEQAKTLTGIASSLSTANSLSSDLVERLEQQVAQRARELDSREKKLIAERKALETESAAIRQRQTDFERDRREWETNLAAREEQIQLLNARVEETERQSIAAATEAEQRLANLRQEIESNFRESIESELRPIIRSELYAEIKAQFETEMDALLREREEQTSSALRAAEERAREEIRQTEERLAANLRAREEQSAEAMRAVEEQSATALRDAELRTASLEKELDEARQLLDRERKEHERRLAAMSKELEQQKTQVKQLVLDAAKQFETSQKQIQELQARLESGEVASVEEHSQLVQELRTEVDYLRNQLKEKEEALGPANELLEYERQLNEFRDQLEQVQNDLAKREDAILGKEKSIQDKMRDTELELSRERAKIAREQALLVRMQNEIRDELVQLHREAEQLEQTAAIQRIKTDMRQSHAASYTQEPSKSLSDKIKRFLKSLGEP